MIDNIDIDDDESTYFYVYNILLNLIIALKLEYIIIYN